MEVVQSRRHIEQNYFQTVKQMEAEKYQRQREKENRDIQIALEKYDQSK